MATIIFTLPEILKIIQSNLWEPEQIENLKSEGNKAWFKFKTGLKICPNINVLLEFIIFERDKAVVLMTTNWLISKIVKKKLDDMIIQNKFENYIDLNGYPKITIDINKILTAKIKDIQIKDITFKEGLFTITT